MKRCYFLLSVFLVALATPQSGFAATTFGTYVGSTPGTNKGYHTDLQLRLSEDVVGSDIFDWSGTLVMTKKGQKTGLAFKITGITQQLIPLGDIGGSGEATMRKNGKLTAIALTGNYDPETDEFLMIIHDAKYGNFKIHLNRRLGTKEMNGTWRFPDGTPMVIRKLSNGKFQGTWTGINGHTDLHGFMTGDAVNGVWGASKSGKYGVAEGLTTVQGTFDLKYLPRNPGEELVGTTRLKVNKNPFVNGKLTLIKLQ